MKCVFQIMIFLMLASTANAGSGPCVRKLLATGDRVQDTTQFTTYLESLIDKRVVSLNDLDPFLKELESGTLTNPVPNSKANKFLVFWHREFQTLIDVRTVDLSQVKTWLSEYIGKTQARATQKENTKQQTEELPYIAYDGAMFFKFIHPTLGVAYKILKPGGHTGNPDDWEKIIWPAHSLHNGPKGSDTFRFLTTNEGSPISKAQRLCQALGGTAHLPSVEDFRNLLRHFEDTKKDVFRLTDRGSAEITSVFPDAQDWYWTTSISTGEHIGSTAGEIMVVHLQGGFTLASNKATDRNAIYCIGVNE